MQFLKVSRIFAKLSVSIITQPCLGASHQKTAYQTLVAEGAPERLIKVQIPMQTQ